VTASVHQLTHVIPVGGLARQYGIQISDPDFPGPIYHYAYIDTVELDDESEYKFSSKCAELNYSPMGQMSYVPRTRRDEREADQRVDCTEESGECLGGGRDHQSD